MKCFLLLCVSTCLNYVACWTTEDMELFDLVENTPQNFYDVLGVDPKASPSDIRKAYRKLSTMYHPDKNKENNAEEVFRRIAAVADVLRNDERRKTYDLILKTGLPDWRAPIYYYRRVRNMGLLEMTIFLVCLATLAQYLFAWSSYWEKKYEIEEVVLSRIRKKAKNQRKNKLKIDEDATVAEVMSELEKPKCKDLFPIRLVSILIHVIRSSPSYLAICVDYIKLQRASAQEEEEDSAEDFKSEARVKFRKQAKPKIPEYSDVVSHDNNVPVTSNICFTPKTHDQDKQKQSWNWDNLTEQQVLDFKKAIKKFPVGTLERWEKVAAYLNCSVSEVVCMIKQMRNQQVSKSVPASAQGVTGTEMENFGTDLYTEKKGKPAENYMNGNCANGSVVVDSADNSSDRHWKQDEQRTLELALQKYPKDTPARWDKIASFVSTKSKEECIERFKILAQQVKKKKEKNV